MNCLPHLKRITSNALLLILLSTTAGCSFLIKDPSELLNKLSKPEQDASTVDLMVYAKEDINVNKLNEPAPVNFLVIQMRNDIRLFSATFEELSGDIEAVLKKDYIDHQEYMVEPGKFTHVGPFELEEKTKFIAIISAYRDLEQVIWRASHKVKDKKKTYSVHVILNKDGVKMELQDN